MDVLYIVSARKENKIELMWECKSRVAQYISTTMLREYEKELHYSTFVPNMLDVGK